MDAFLTELISVVGQQFERLQADLQQSQIDHVKVNSHFVCTLLQYLLVLSIVKCSYSLTSMLPAQGSSNMSSCNSMSITGRSQHGTLSYFANASTFTQAIHMKAEVQTALIGICSPAAGDNQLGQWVYRAVTDFMKQDKGHQVCRITVQNGLICVI